MPTTYNFQLGFLSIGVIADLLLSWLSCMLQPYLWLPYLPCHILYALLQVLSVIGASELPCLALLHFNVGRFCPVLVVPLARQLQLKTFGSVPSPYVLGSTVPILPTVVVRAIPPVHTMCQIA